MLKNVLIVIGIALLGLGVVYQEIQRIRYGYVIIEQAEQLTELRERLRQERDRVEQLKEPGRLIELNEVMGLGLKPHGRTRLVRVPIQE